MKIYNINKTEELSKDNIDYAKGRLIEDKILIGQEPDTIVVTDDGFGNVVKDIKTFKNVYEDIFVFVPYTQKQLYENEIFNLKKWFDNEYRILFEKCTRKINLGLNMKDGSNPRTILENLFQQAEKNTRQIHELEKLIEEYPIQNQQNNNLEWL